MKWNVENRGMDPGQGTRQGGCRRGLRLYRLILLVLAFAVISAGSVFAAQAKLDYSFSHDGAGQFRMYIFQRGQKTYLKDQGGYYLINIPDGQSLGMTVYFEIQPATCYRLTGLQSDDIAINRDEKNVMSVKFTKARDDGQTRHIKAIFATNHTMVIIPKVDATCEKAGNKQYYRCTTCGKYYEDANGVKQTTPDKMTIKALGHKWDKGVVTRKATRAQTGLITYTCQRCRATKTKTIPKLYVDPMGNGVITPDTPADFSSVERKILKTKYKKPGSGDSFGLLFLKAKVTKGKIKLTWKGVPTAKKYVIYMAQAGHKFKKLATTKGKQYSPKKLKGGKYYEFVVVAVNGNKAVAVSKPVYASGGKGNPSSVTATPTGADVKVGHVRALSATFEKSGGTYKALRGLRYESSNVDVATVTNNGSVVGVAPGVCLIRVYVQNGLYAEVTISVYR